MQASNFAFLPGLFTVQAPGHLNPHQRINNTSTALDGQS
jgi:hypothetical protein